MACHPENLPLNFCQIAGTLLARPLTVVEVDLDTAILHATDNGHELSLCRVHADETLNLDLFLTKEEEPDRIIAVLEAVVAGDEAGGSGEPVTASPPSGDSGGYESCCEHIARRF